MSKVEKEYLTTRLVKAKSERAFSEASKKAMLDHGHVVVAKDGRVVKEFSDGRIEVLEELSTVNVDFSLD